jgi:hypothetical protein
MNKHNVLLVTLTLSLAGIVSATDKQSFTVSAPLQAVPGQPVTGTLTEQQTTSLVETVVTDADQRADRAFMVHVVKYQSGKLTPSTQNWYVADFTPTPAIETFGNLGVASRYKNPRIYGRKQLGIVYLHILEAVSASAVEAYLRDPIFNATLRASLTHGSDADQIADIKSDIADIQSINPANSVIARFNAAAPPSGASLTSLWTDVTVEWTIVKLLDKGSAGPTTLVSSKGNQLVPWNGYFVESGMNSLTTLVYGANIQSKTPAPLQNLQQILSLAFTAESSSLRKIPFTLVYTGFAAGGVFDTTLTPSDVAVTATYTSGGKDTQIGSQTYDDEGRYWYDFTLALPIATFNNLSYDSTGNTITARSITKANLFAAFNIGVPRDTKSENLLLIPTLLYGIPIANQPLQHHLFAASMGIKYVTFFVGTRLDEKTFYHDFSQPLTGDNAFRVWRTHLTYGINFPVATVVKALSKGK